MDGRRAVLGAAGVGAAFTVVVLVSPILPFAVRDPLLHVAVEVTASWIALTAALLIAGRVRRRGRLPDLALLVALGLTGSVNLLLSAAPSILGGLVAEQLATWGALTGRILAAGAFAWAAFAPDRELARRPWASLTAIGCLLVVAAIAAVVLVSEVPLPPGADGVTEAGIPRVGRFAAYPTLALGQLLMAVAYLAAAVGFVRRSRRTGDGLLVWLAAAAVLAAFARIHFALLPSLYIDVVYSGDVLRVGFYAVLLGGVLAELLAIWRALGAAAAADERRRIARDLHDGLAQELSFIATQATWLARRQPDERRVALLASAAQRALDESRRAIETLAGTASSSLPAAIARAVEEVSSRYQQRVELDLDDAVEVSADLCEHLVRIVREAVGNAARHGEPDTVVVRTIVGERVVVEIEDDGVGFDEEAVAGERLRFGLRSMRERAESLGGECSVRSVPGEGTLVRVEVPWNR